jgi:glycerol-3-phosphate dehydrogenase
MNRTSNLEEIKLNQDWDIAIIGGGSSGLGIAIDAANRGYKTVLF